MAGSAVARFPLDRSPLARVAAVGDAFVDRYVAPAGVSLVGGNALNVAVHLARLGCASAFLGAVGDDPAGARIRRTLDAQGVDIRHLVTAAGPTASTDIGVDPSGERTFLAEDYGVARSYFPDAAAIAALHETAAVHVGWLADPPALRAALRGSGAILSQDTAVSPADGGLDVAFGSAGPYREAARAMLARLVARNRIAVVTCGALGAIASDGRETAEVGIVPVDVVDTTGAGDSFAAGFLAAHIRGVSLPECLAAGRDTAAATCTHIGAFPQSPEPL